MKKKVENVHSSSIEPNIYIGTIFANLKNSRKECQQMWEASKIHRSQVKGLSWNCASIVVATLDCIMILKLLDCMSRTLIDKVIRQILDTSKDELVF
jgi:hypothetical protein